MPVTAPMGTAAGATALRPGDSRGLASLYEDHKQALYFFVYTYLRHRESAEEIVQDTFLKLWENRHTLRPDTDLRAYLFQVAKHATLDALRRQKVEQTFLHYQLATASAGHSDTEQQVEWADYQALIQQALTQLPPARQQIFRLSREQELTYDEIAQRTNLSVKAVEKQMMKALRSVRGYLRKHAGLTTATLLIVVEYGV